MRRLPAIAIFIICLVIGVTAGLGYAWLVDPSTPLETTPAKLNPADRETYIRLIAAGFAADNDEEDAARRLAALGPTAKSELIELIVTDMQIGQSSPAAKQLIELAARLNIDAPVVDLLAPPYALPPATADAPVVTITPPHSPSNAGAFVLISSEELCAPQVDASRIEITIENSEGNPLPGIVITVTWEGGRNRFFTGFTADQSAGFADFEMEPEVVYSIAVADDSPSISDLQSHLCPDGHAGGWRLAYRLSEPQTTPRLPGTSP